MGSRAAPPRADDARGRVHVVEVGAGEPVVLLHQTPRSWDEYRDVLPLLGERFQALAIDSWASAARATLRGSRPSSATPPSRRGARRARSRPGARRRPPHRRGGRARARSLAARPVVSLVLSSCPYADEEFRRERGGRSPVDNDPSPEGLRAGRARLLPPDSPDLLDRFVADALRSGGEHARRAQGGRPLPDGDARRCGRFTHAADRCHGRSVRVPPARPDGARAASGDRARDPRRHCSAPGSPARGVRGRGG